MRKFPTNIPIYVPNIYPNVPTNIVGATKRCQPFDTAMAAAVVGPPMFAFDAKIASSMVNPNTFAPKNVTNIFTKTIMAQNTNSNGDFAIIASIEAGIPITTKNK